MRDHVVGEIECGEGHQMFEALHVIRVREKFLQRYFALLQLDDQYGYCEGRDTSVPPNVPFLTTILSKSHKYHIFIITVGEGISGNCNQIPSQNHRQPCP